MLDPYNSIPSPAEIKEELELSNFLDTYLNELARNRFADLRSKCNRLEKVNQRATSNSGKTVVDATTVVTRLEESTKLNDSSSIYSGDD